MLPRTPVLVLLLGFVAGCAEAVTEPNPAPLETIPFPPPQQPRAKDEFSLTDRVQAERYLAQAQQRFLEIAKERNAVVRAEKLAELTKSLKELEGKFVMWEFPTRFLQDGRSIVLDLPGKRQATQYQLATTNYGDYLLEALTTPQLRLGRELDTAAFRKLKGGERVKFKAIVNKVDTTYTVNLNLVGRIVEDPFGQPITHEAFQAKSTWAGQCVADRSRYSLKIVVTDRTKDTFAGTGTDLKGSRAYAVTGKLDGDKAELTIHRGNDREVFPYFTTFKGTITDGFLMKGTFEKGHFVFSLME